MSSYLPAKKTYAVCTKQLGSAVLNFVVHEKLRTQQSVNYKNSEYRLLTVQDKKMSGNFSCKTCWSSGVGTIAFGVGIITGLAIAAAVATVPVVGWIVGGCIALGCIAYGLFQLFSTPSCNDMIGYKESEWLLPHKLVKFDKEIAVTKLSLLKCKEGGFLLPFISQSMASNAAAEIAAMNDVDLAINVVANFIAGIGTGYSMGASGLMQTGKDAFVGLLGAFIVFQPLAKLEQQGIRAIGDNHNPYYDEMMKQTSLDFSPTRPDLTTTPGDEQFNPLAVKTALNDIRDLAVRAGADKQHIDQINAAIADAQKKGSYAINENPKAKVVFENAKSGVYGDQVKDRFTNKAGNGRGMNRSENYKNATDTIQENLSSAETEMQMTKALNAANIATLIMPFVSTAINESEFIILANDAKGDLKNNISIFSKKH